MTEAIRVRDEIMSLPLPPRCDGDTIDKELEAEFRSGFREARYAAAEVARRAIEQFEQSSASLFEAQEDATAMVWDSGRRAVAKVTKERDMYRELFENAIKNIDRVFQVAHRQHPPLLPDFLKLGEDKFEGAIRLAIAYLKEQKRNAALVAACERIAALDYSRAAVNGAAYHAVTIAKEVLQKQGQLEAALEQTK
jgi:hypothetical protein